MVFEEYWMTSLETYAGLRIFSEDIYPDEISKIIGIDSFYTVPRDFNGQGALQLSCGIMESLVSLGLDISWQVYFVDEEE